MIDSQVEVKVKANERQKSSETGHPELVFQDLSE
jgi:hypothetical protein